MKHKMQLFLAIFIILSMMGEISWSDTSEDEEMYTALRLDMVKRQIKSRGVKDEKVLATMRKVPRHEFVSTEQLHDAYKDSPLPIGSGQTISQPYIVAYMTELLKPQKEHKVLEVGTGSGYQAAVLAEIVDKVYTIEIIEELGVKAQERIKRLEYKNVEVKIEDGYNGWEKHAPFDSIIVTAAAEHVPPPLIKQLKPGGIMCIPVGSPFFVQDLTVVEKKKDGKITIRKVLPVRFVPLVRKKKEK